MGWTFPWASSFSSDFNFDFGAAFTQAQQQTGIVYNYGREPAQGCAGPEIPTRATPEGPALFVAM
jgi:predicted dithiol-disulfide oxidoreductase (DUF899 family)